GPPMPVGRRGWLFPFPARSSGVVDKQMNGGNGTSAVADAPLPFVRQSVRDLLLASPAYHELPPEQKREMAGVMVRVCDTAARLVAEELASGAAVQSLLDERENGATAEPAAAPPLARAQAAGDA